MIHDSAPDENGKRKMKNWFKDYKNFDVRVGKSEKLIKPCLINQLNYFMIPTISNAKRSYGVWKTEEYLIK